MPKNTLRVAASSSEARTALDTIASSGVFTMRGVGGRTWKTTLDDVREWHEIEYADEGQPALGAGELTEILMSDVMFGRLTLRPDGMWESEQPYFGEGVSE